MALLEEGLFGWLSSRTALTAYVSTRIYPVKLPQRPSYPAVTYFRVQTDQIHSASGGPGSGEIATLQIDSWSDDYLEAKRVAEVLRLELQGYRGPMGASVIRGVEYQNGRDLYDDQGQDPGVHHVVQEFRVMFDAPIV